MPVPSGQSDIKAMYRQFCRQQTQLPVFLQDWYLDAVCEDGEWEVILAKNKEEIVGVLPYFIKKKGPFTYLTMPRFVKHLGPYLIPAYRQLKDQHRVYGELIDKLPAFARFQQSFTPMVRNWLPFYWQGFEQSTRYTYRLDLKDTAALQNGLNRNIRRNIRKAKQALELRMEGSIEAFYRINSLSFKRQGIPVPYTLDQLIRHDEAMRQNGARQLFFAVDKEGQTHAVAYLIWDGLRSYYHLAGEDPELRNSGAGILLIWEAIAFTRDQLGLESFDFEGSMLPGVEAIRRQFGARQLPYFFVWKYNSNLLKLLDQWRN